VKHSVKFDLFRQLRQLEAQNEKQYSYRDIARSGTMHRHTVERIASNESNEKMLRQLAELLDFFHAEGMPIEIGDLFSVERA
jgi:hypothetical protein